jgi:putative transposase
MQVKYQFIEAEKARFPVGELCRVLGVGRSGYYAWCDRPESEHARADRRIGVDVRTVFESSKRRYGSPRVHAELQAQGRPVGRHRIARLMRVQGLQARRRRKFVSTTNSKHGLPVAKNIVARQFEAPARDHVWVGDVTYIATLEGWLYLAVLLDLFSRRVVGWATSDRNDEALTLTALHMALEEREPPSGQLTHHTDRGTTYASTEYQDVLQKRGIKCSMSRKGNCWDNAVAESFFSSLKTEGLATLTFPSRAAARRAVFEYIAAFYNSTRRHSTLNYQSPMEFEGSIIR